MALDLGGLAGATPWGALGNAISGLSAGPAGPSQSGDIGGSGIGIAPVVIAGPKASAAANGAMNIPMWVWIAGAVVVALYALRKK